MDNYILKSIERSLEVCGLQITKGSSGNVKLHYKRFSDSPWEPEGKGIKVITVSCILSFS